MATARLQELRVPRMNRKGHYMSAMPFLYGARYIVTSHPLEALDARRVNTDATGRYFLYDLGG